MISLTRQCTHKLAKEIGEAKERKTGGSAVT